MISSTPRTEQAASANPHTAESEAARLREHRRLSDLTAQEVVEGLRKLAAQKKGLKDKQNPAA